MTDARLKQGQLTGMTPEPNLPFLTQTYEDMEVPKESPLISKRPISPPDPKSDPKSTVQPSACTPAATANRSSDRVYVNVHPGQSLAEAVQEHAKTKEALHPTLPRPNPSPKPASHPPKTSPKPRHQPPQTLPKPGHQGTMPGHQDTKTGRQGPKTYPKPTPQPSSPAPQTSPLDVSRAYSPPPKESDYVNANFLEEMRRQKAGPGAIKLPLPVPQVSDSESEDDYEEG